MHVLVVGGAGYIGSIHARFLKQRGHEVTVVDNLSTGHRQAIDGPLIEGDVRDRHFLAELFSEHGFDGVMHFAAKSLVGESVSHPLRYFDNNTSGTTNLVHAMLEAGANNLVFSSTCAIYGVPEALPLSEDHPRAPISPYGHSKQLVEEILSSVRQTEGLRCTTLRYFNAAGAWADGSLGESHDPETHLIPIALAAARGKRPPLQLFGTDYDTRDGTCIRDYVHVLDLAEAHLSALERLVAGDAGDGYNLGTGVGSTVREVIEAVARATGSRVPHQEAPRRTGDPPALYADFTRARQELGWSPRLTLDDCVASALAWEESRTY